MTESNKPLETGPVFRKSLGCYYVHLNGREIACTISSKLRKELVYPTANASSRRRRVDNVKKISVVDPVTIGDEVAFLDSGDGTGVIKEVHVRRNMLSRPAPGSHREQVIVTNVDQIVVVCAAAKPKTNWNLLDRYLVSTEAAGIPSLICLTKSDLAKDNLALDERAVYDAAGYRTIVSSAITGEGIEDVKECLKGRLSVFVGNSGVGKTTLLNSIQPDLCLRVNEVSSVTGKGKHTTTHLEMFALDFGGAIIDTPGMREFGLWNIRADMLDTLFPEMRPYLGHCRFGGKCTHTHEPDCTIQQRVALGEISERRYRNYVNLRQECVKS